MAKSRYSKMPGNMQYNRPSGGYQKNLYKQQLNAANVKQPKGLEQKKVRIVAIAVSIVWLAVSVLLIMKLRWWGLLIGVVVGALIVGGGYLFIQYKEREIIKYYKTIGMTEEMYVKELKKRNVDKKQIAQVRKTWNKVEADPITVNQKGGSKSSGSKDSSKKGGSKDSGKKSSGSKDSDKKSGGGKDGKKK